ncbi:u-box domain protein [Ichthyophthirius multifiliis]|uniref:RING-type E3 ubiquitin transferase n=1 Tax=Ichthyophthirius multifiliis TaxID=5932 RepID=G0R447_ICHMU|nr:u-box domain protein [Ichthyophthirius multifiliis]EGR27767.1 u-box domain protein [Ichthyophthirius multifiliis]|eukprot:XP_004025219.1 u-box domain protein [Ichthyophthirius multifiliis]
MQDQPNILPVYQNTRQNSKKKEFQEPKKRKKKSDPLQNTGNYWKQKANDAFNNNNLETAIEYYTQAIEIDSSQSIYYSNRGKCYKKLDKIKQAFDDAVHAIELDENNIKAQLLCGQTLCEIGKNEKSNQKILNGIKRLTRAFTLCSGNKKQQYEKDISIYIYRAKKLLWYKQYEDLKQKKMELLESYKKQIESQNLSQENTQDEINKFIQFIGDPYQQQELSIPDYLVCKISLDLMEDPVITECGQTYEKVVLDEHFKKNGYIDPITRKQISQKVYTNLSVKQGIQEFLNINPWAFEFSQYENYKTIEF